MKKVSRRQIVRLIVSHNFAKDFFHETDCFIFKQNPRWLDIASKIRLHLRPLLLTHKISS